MTKFPKNFQKVALFWVLFAQIWAKINFLPRLVLSVLRSSRSSNTVTSWKKPEKKQSIKHSFHMILCLRRLTYKRSLTIFMAIFNFWVYCLSFWSTLVISSHGRPNPTDFLLLLVIYMVLNFQESCYQIHWEDLGQ